jgi:hypothetical protein
VAVMRGDPASSALRQLVADLLGTSDGATQYVRRASGLGQCYDVGDPHPLAGRIAPALIGHTPSGRALLVDRTGDLADAAAPYAGRLDYLHADLKAITLSGLLIRPDGVVAWASDAGSQGLPEALRRWLGG